MRCKDYSLSPLNDGFLLGRNRSSNKNYTLQLMFLVSMQFYGLRCSCSMISPRESGPRRACWCFTKLWADCVREGSPCMQKIVHKQPFWKGNETVHVSMRVNTPTLHVDTCRIAVRTMRANTPLRAGRNWYSIVLHNDNVFLASQ